jgi:hypothetical protein
LIERGLKMQVSDCLARISSIPGATGGVTEERFVANETQIYIQTFNEMVAGILRVRES